MLSCFKTKLYLFYTSDDICPGFQSQGGSLACMLHHWYAAESSDSPLVQHLLASWQPVSQPRCSNPHTSKQELIGRAWVWVLLCCCLTAWDKTDALHLDWTLFRIYCGPEQYKFSEFLKIQHDFVWLRTEALFQMYLQLIYLKWFCLSVNFTSVTMKLLLDNCLSNVLIRNTLPTGGISEDHQFFLTDKTALSNSFPLWLLYKFGQLQEAPKDRCDTEWHFSGNPTSAYSLKWKCTEELYPLQKFDLCDRTPRKVIYQNRPLSKIFRFRLWHVTGCATM